MLNKFWFGTIDDDVENSRKAIFIRESDENHQKDTLHIYTENEPAMERNEAVLNDLPSELYTIESNDKIPDNCNRIKKQTKTGGFAELFKFKDWSKSNVNS